MVTGIPVLNKRKLVWPKTDINIPNMCIKTLDLAPVQCMMHILSEFYVRRVRTD